MRLFAAPLILALLMPLAARAQEVTPILTLQQLTDGAVTQEVTVLGNSIDPNKRSTEDRFALRINGKPARAPQAFLAELATARRAFSYDHFTQGIDRTDRLARCMMAGPATGWVLSTRYLTYRDHQITADAMSPILSEPGNCLFTTQIAPKSGAAHVAAAKTLGAMQALLALR